MAGGMAAGTPPRAVRGCARVVAVLAGAALVVVLGFYAWYHAADHAARRSAVREADRAAEAYAGGLLAEARGHPGFPPAVLAEHASPHPLTLHGAEQDGGELVATVEFGA